MAAVSNYNKKYLRMTPTVTQIFEDLEIFKDWVRMQSPAIAFNEADLYKNSSPTWQKYNKSRNRRNHGSR